MYTYIRVCYICTKHEVMLQMQLHSMNVIQSSPILIVIVVVYMNIVT